MARIRSIKPEFHGSESMGHVSRDARLLFILLFTIADDEGRMRGNSRYLAHTLFPDDDDVEHKIGAWLRALEAERCIVLYEFEQNEYLAITNWSRHQRIDHPMPSRLPSPPRLNPTLHHDPNQLPLPEIPTEMEIARHRRDRG